MCRGMGVTTMWSAWIAFVLSSWQPNHSTVSSHSLWKPSYSAFRFKPETNTALNKNRLEDFYFSHYFPLWDGWEVCDGRKWWGLVIHELFHGLGFGSSGWLDTFDGNGKRRTIIQQLKVRLDGWVCWIFLSLWWKCWGVDIAWCLYIQIA